MHHIIVNPIAGRGQTLVRVPLLTKLFDQANLSYEVIHTTAPMDAFNIAKQICKDGKSLGIIGFGGDGTIQEIVAGMAAAFNFKAISVPLGIFPAGSGNDFVMTLDGGKNAALKKYNTKHLKTTTEAFFNNIKQSQTRFVDIIKVNKMTCLNIGNIGLDARIVDNAIGLKERFGRFAYLAAVYKSICQHENMPLTIEVNGKVLEGKYTLAAICNGQYYGGGMKIAPPASLDDGKITLCLIKAMSKLKTMTFFPSLLFAKHTKLKEVSFISCEKLQIRLNEKTAQTLCLDGNLFPFDGSLDIEIIPQALNVFM